MAKKKVFTKKTKKSKKGRKSSSGTRKTKRVAKKPSVKKAARKPQAKMSAKPAAQKASKKSVKKALKKGVAKKAASSAKTKKASKAGPKKKIKSPLSKKQLQAFRALLLEKRKSLLGDMSGIQAGALGRNLQESAGDLSNMPTHPADIGSDNFEHEFTLGLLESERSLLHEIHEALERIDDGTYGVCLGTGDPIGIPRLKARPWCKYCIEYQKMIEKGLVRPGQDDSYGSDDDEDDEEDEDEMEEQED